MAIRFVGPCAAAAAMAGAAVGQVRFEEREIAPGAYLSANGMVAGAVAADYDDDGDIDLYLPTRQGTPDMVLRNRGDGTFDSVAAELGLDSLDHNRGGLWIDYDGDDLLDLLTVQDCHMLDPCPTATTLRLYRQAPAGAFTEVTEKAGLFGALPSPAPNKHAGGIAAGDLNNDGWLDIWVTWWHDATWVFFNNGDGTFRDVTAGTGVGFEGTCWQPIIWDIDGDGWQDVMANVDFTENHLWHNQRDGTFVDIAPAAGVATAFNEMGITMGDYNGDGRFDFFSSNVFEARPGAHSVLLRREPGPEVRFSSVGMEAGVGDTNWGWGATFLDADNDTMLDLAVTNGFVNPDPDPSRLFMNLGDGTFEDRAPEFGLADMDWGGGYIAFDADRDGWLDIAQVCIDAPVARLWMNTPEPVAQNRHWLVVRPRMTGPNTRAIGALVQASRGRLTQMRPILAGTSVLSQEPPEAHFGLGDSDAPLSWVSVTWPDGTQTTLGNVALDQVIDVLHDPCEVDLNGDGVVDMADFIEFGVRFTAGDPTTDLDRDGSLTFMDWLEFQSRSQFGCE
jgi:hypothetical protein